MTNVPRHSYWEKDSFFAPSDILIVGSGFTGLWSAYFLKKLSPRLRITVVERGIIPSGASTRNAGFACFGSPTELLSDETTYGTDRMLSLVEQRFRGLSMIRETFDPAVTRYELTGGYELISPDTEQQYPHLHEQLGSLNALLRSVTGISDTYRFADELITSFGFAGVRHMIRNNMEGELHPGRLCQQLLQRVQGMGVLVLSGFEVEGYTRTGPHFSVSCTDGIQLQAERLLVCTNAFAAHLLPDFGITPARGQVLLTDPILSLPFRGTFHYDKGYYYFRNVGNRILLGGARNSAFDAETTFDLSTSSGVQEALERFISRVILPGQAFNVADRWSGIMGMGREKSPVVTEASEGVFCAVGMGGIGVATAPVVAEKVARMMCGIR